MQSVTAYEDNGGRLHKTRRAAIISDFTGMVHDAWLKAPAVDGRGDALVIASILCAPNYGVRQALLEALLFLEENLKAIE